MPTSLRFLLTVRFLDLHHLVHVSWTCVRHVCQILPTSLEPAFGTSVKPCPRLLNLRSVRLSNLTSVNEIDWQKLMQTPMCKPRDYLPWLCAPEPGFGCANPEIFWALFFSRLSMVWWYFQGLRCRTQVRWCKVRENKPWVCTLESAFGIESYLLQASTKFSFLLLSCLNLFEVNDLNV